MATPITHLLSCFLLFSFFYSTLCLLNPEDEVGFLVELDGVNMVQSNRDSSSHQQKFMNPPKNSIQILDFLYE
jgi:hypothetical protein